MIQFKKILLLGCCLVLCCCGSDDPKRKPATTQEAHVQQPEADIQTGEEEFPRGEVIPAVPLANDTFQSFALYLPADVADSVEMPVIIFFDPDGDGTYPLKRYQELAAQYGFAMLGSNSSKNGLALAQTTQMANALVQEAKRRLPIDQNRIFFCGFSGGAKVALAAGAQNAAVSAIVYCGAAISVRPNHKLSLLGFAGTRDMNYTDVVAFDQSLQHSNIPHFLVQWNGKHEFPTAEVFEDAFIFLNTGQIPNYTAKHATITPQEISEEQQWKQYYLQAFQEKDLTWWQNAITQLNLKKKNDVMYDRLLGFISLACYSFVDNALQKNNLEAAGHILAIYGMADPKNEDYKKFKKELEQRRQ